jgi:hypothetical protein
MRKFHPTPLLTITMSNTYYQTLEQLETVTNPFIIVSDIFIKYCDDSIAPEEIFERLVKFCLDNINDVIPEELEDQVKSNLSELNDEKRYEYLAFVLASLPEIWPMLLRKATNSFHKLGLPIEADYKEKSEMLAKILNYIHLFEEEI